MISKSTFKKRRDSLQKGIYFIINPFVKLLIRMGVTPNMVTTIAVSYTHLEVSLALRAYASMVTSADKGGVRKLD